MQSSNEFVFIANLLPVKKMADPKWFASLIRPPGPPMAYCPPTHTTIYINDMLMTCTLITSSVGSDLLGLFIPQGYLWIIITDCVPWLLNKNQWALFNCFRFSTWQKNEGKDMFCLWDCAKISAQCSFQWCFSWRKMYLGGRTTYCTINSSTLSPSRFASSLHFIPVHIKCELNT